MPAGKSETKLNGEGSRRSAGSGPAKYERCDSIGGALLFPICGYKAEAGAGPEVCGDSNRRDGAKPLSVGAGGLAQRCTRGGGHGRHQARNACMRPVSPAAYWKQLLRRGHCYHRRRWQQCSEDAQQEERRDPPHALSVHGIAGAAKHRSWHLSAWI